jgi:hypothetical protein
LAAKSRAVIIPKEDEDDGQAPCADRTRAAPDRIVFSGGMDADLPILHSKLTDLLLSAQHSSPRRRRLSLAVEFAQDARDGHRFGIAAAVDKKRLRIIILCSAQLVPRSEKSSSPTKFIRSRACINFRRLLSILYVGFRIFFSCLTTFSMHFLDLYLSIHIFLFLSETILKNVFFGY